MGTNDTINRNLHMDKGRTTPNIQKQQKPDNTIVRNKTQIVLGYQLYYSKNGVQSRLALDRKSVKRKDGVLKTF